MSSEPENVNVKTRAREEEVPGTQKRENGTEDYLNNSHSQVPFVYNSKSNADVGLATIHWQRAPVAPLPVSPLIFTCGPNEDE